MSRVSPGRARTTIAAAPVEINPGGMRELHWHPNTDEWQYYLDGKVQAHLRLDAQTIEALRKEKKPIVPA